MSWMVRMMSLAVAVRKQKPQGIVRPLGRLAISCSAVTYFIPEFLWVKMLV
jgi:hypothetical protein